MAKAFNLTAQLNLQGPNNLKPIISKIESALGKIKANINVDVKDTSIKNLKAITTNMQALSQAATLARTNVDSLNSSLANMGAGISRVGSVSSSAATGIDKIKQSAAAASKDVSRAGSAVEDFGKQAGLAVKRFAAFSIVTGVIYGLGSALTSALGEFVSFDKEMVRLSQVTGNSASELKGLKAEITNLSTSLGVGSQDLLLVSTTLAQAGLSAKDTTAALEALAKSALAPSFDNLTQTTEGAIAIMRQFGIQAGELEGALGSINSVAAAFAVESADIITAIQRTGGVFASASRGVSEGSAALNEFIAVFTSVRATTRESAETIATGLRTIFTRIQRGDTIDALKSYGIELTDLEGKFVGPYEATKRLSEGLKSLDPRDLRFSQVVEQLGGFRQIGKVIPLIQQFAVAQDALNVAQKGSGSLSKDAVTAQQSLAVQFTKTRESFLALVRDLADSSSFRAFVSVALTLTNSLIGLAGALKPLLPLLLAFAAVKIGSSLGNLGSGFLGGLRGNRKSEGGTIRGFARGGFVPGTGSGDTIPAMLEPGEFVIRKKAVDTLGASNLHSMNKSGGGSIQKFAAGGGVLKVDFASRTPGVKGEKTLISKHIASSVNDLTKWYGGTGKASAGDIQTMGQYDSIVGSIVEASIKQLDNGTVAGDSGAFDLPRGFSADSKAGSLFDTIGNASFPIDIKKSKSSYFNASLMKKISNWYNSKKGTKKIDKEYQAGELEIGAAVYEQGKKDKNIPFKLNLDREKDGEKRTKTASLKKWQGGMIQKFGTGGLLRGGFKYEGGSSRDSVGKYQTESSYVNRGLLNDKVREQDKKIITDLDRAPKQIPPKSLYTGFGQSRFGSMSQQLKSELLSTEDISKVSGQNFALPGFLSTSTSVNQAKKFGNTGMLNISTKGQATAIDVEGTISPKDSKMRSLAADTNGLGSEREFILPRNAQMRLLSGSRSGSNQFLNLNVQELARGGGIQKFGIGGKATAAEMYAAIKSSKLRVPNESMFGQFAGKELTDEIIRQVKRPPDASMGEEKREAYRNTGLFVQDAYDKDQAVIAAKLAERIKKSTKVALVGLLPFGHSKNTGPIDINGRDIMIYERGLDKQYEQAVLNMQAGSAGVANQFATDIQKTATIGGLKEYDFDDTLVTGAGVFDADGKIDVPGYKNIDRVKEALKAAKLTPLGVDLKQQLESDPTALANIRIRTARPQSNAPELSKTLARLGLNIPATLITGLDGANKAVGLNPKATLVDDHAKNIEDVRKAGKKGIQYAPISALSQNVSMATGQANIEGAFIEQAMAMFGAPIIPDAKATRAIDYPSGLGPAGSYFGLPPDWPAEVKRTIDSKSRATAIDEFTRYLFPKQVPVGKNLGGSIQKFAMGGASSDTVPAMLTPGEFVINKKAARSIGYSKLNKMNHADSVKGFASGGPVGGVQYFKGGTRVMEAVIESWADPKRKAQAKEVMGNPENVKKIDDFAQKLYEAGGTFEQISGKLKDLVSQIAKEDKASAKITKRQDESFERTGVVRSQQGKPREKPEQNKESTLDIVAMQAAASIFTSAIENLGNQMGILDNVIGQGLIQGLTSATSSALAASTAMTLVGATKKQTQFVSMIAGTGGGVAGIMSGAGTKGVASVEAANSKSITAFDKALQDSADGTKASSQALQTSFLQLYSTVSNNAPFLNFYENLNNLGNGIKATTEAYIQGSAAQVALTNSIPALKDGLWTLVKNVGGPRSMAGGALTGAFGGLLKAVPYVGVALAAFTAVTGVVGLLSSRSKAAAENLQKLSKAALEASRRAPENQVGNENRDNTIALFKELTAAQQKTATAVINTKLTDSGLTPEQQNNPNIDPAFKLYNINPFNTKFIQESKGAILAASNIGSNDKRAKATLSELLMDQTIHSFYGKIEPLFATRNNNAPGAIQSGDKITDNNMANSIIKNIYKNIFFRELYKPAQNSTQQADSDTQLSDIRAQALQTAGNEVSRSSQNLINTLNLLDKALLKLSDTTSIAMSDLDQSMNDQLGKATVNTSSVFQTNSTTFGNLAGSSSAQIEQALNSTKQFALSQTSSNVPSERSFNDQAEADFAQISNNTKLAANVAKELPIALNRISGDSDMKEGDIKAIIASVFTIKDSGGKSVPVSDSVNTMIGGLAEAILNARTKGGTQQINLNDVPSLNKELGKYIEILNKSPEAMKNFNDTMTKGMDLFAVHFNKLMAVEMNVIDLKAQRDTSQTDMTSEIMRFGGKNPSLKMLNSPFDNQIRNLTGGATDAVSIKKNIDDANIENAKAIKSFDMDAQAKFTLSINKNQKALELLANTSTKFNNAMSEAARIKSEESNKGDLLKQILATTGDPRAFNDMTNRLDSIKAVLAGTATEGQTREAMANTQLIPAQFMPDFEAALQGVVERLSGRRPGDLSMLNPGKGKPVTAAMQVVAQEQANMKTAQDGLIKQSQDVLKDQRDRLTVIVDKFLVELDNSLMNVNEGISGMSVVEKRSTTPITRLSPETQQRALLNQRMMGNAIDQFPSVKQNPAVKSFLSQPTPTTTDELNTFKDNLGKMMRTDLPASLRDMIHKIPIPSLILTDANRANPTAPLSAPAGRRPFNLTSEEKSTPQLKAPPVVKPAPSTKDTQQSGSNQANAASAASEKSLEITKQLNSFVKQIVAISNSSIEQSMTLAKLVNTTVESFSQQAAALPGKFNESFLALGPVLDNFNKGADNLSNAVGSIPNNIALTSNNTTSINFTNSLDLNTDSLEKAIATQALASNTTTKGNPAMLGDLQVLGRTRSVATNIA